MHGLSLFLVADIAWAGGAAHLAGPSAGSRPQPRGAATPRSGWRSPSAGGRTCSVPALASLGLLTLAAALYLAGWQSAALLFALGALLPLVFAARLHSSSGLLVLGMIALGLLALALPEFVTLQGDIDRMNTVFKFHLQAWVLLGLAAAVGLAFVAHHARKLPRGAVGVAGCLGNRAAGAAASPPLPIRCSGRAPRLHCASPSRRQP